MAEKKFIFGKVIAAPYYVIVIFFAHVTLDLLRMYQFFMFVNAASGEVKVAEWLINSDTGGNLVNKKDGNGDTPAHDAADSGYV